MQDAKYYQLQNSRDSKIVGRSLPQLALLYKPGSENHPINQSSGPFPEYDQTITFQLMHGAKWTDLLGQYSLGPRKSLVISPILKELLDKYSLCEHKYYEALVKEENSEIYKPNSGLSLEYGSGIEYIDFEKSLFRYKRGSTIISEHIFENAKQLTDFHTEKCDFRYRLHPKVLHLTKSCKTDVFTFPFDFAIYISDLLASVIEESMISGVDIVSLDWLK